MRRAAGDQLEQRRAQRVDVAARIDRRVTARLLGRHVGGRAHDITRTSDADVALGGDPEIHQLYLPGPEKAFVVRRLAQKQVARLDVAVNHARGVRVLQRLGRPDRELDGLRDGQRLALLACCQIFALEPLHGDERQPALVQHAEAHGLDDARVVEVLEQLAFAREARLFLGRVPSLGRGDHLQGHDLLALQVVRAVHDARATSPNLTLDDEAIPEFPSFRDRRRAHAFRLVPRHPAVDRSGNSRSSA